MAPRGQINPVRNERWPECRARASRRSGIARRIDLTPGHLRPLALALMVAGALLPALPPAPALAQTPPPDLEAPVVLTADELIYDRKGKTLSAEGNVEFSQHGRRLMADRLVWAIEADEVTASGNITLLDPDGNAMFADELRLTGDLREGFISRIGLLMADDSRIAAAAATRTEGAITTLEKAVYSPCRLCEDYDGPPLWQIKAERVIHDQVERTVTYRNAVFEIAGVPVAWTPYFYHPDPTVKRKTGLLAPQFGTDTVLGATLETPFYYDIAPNRDVTITPLFTTDEGILLRADYRELRSFGRTELGGSFTYTSASQRTDDDDQSKELRGHVEGTGRYTLSDTDSAGFDLALASDNTFMDRYDFSDEDVLENRIFAERITGRDYYGLNAYGFQTQRIDDDQGLVPLALPLAEAHREMGEAFGGSWSVDGNALQLIRTEGLDTTRLSTSASWRRSMVGGQGELVELTLGLRGDIYGTNGDPATRTASGQTDVTARLVPTASLDWRLPLVGQRGNWQHVIEPIVTATITGNNANKDGIPNEDSLVFEFDETNLFEANRFTGLDRIESGAKLSYGLRFDSINAINAWRVSGVVGQSVRSGGDDIFDEGSGLEDEVSDYVGRLDFRPGPLVDLSYRFRFAREDLSARRNDVRLSFGPPRLQFDLQYIELSEDLEEDGINRREELVAGVRTRLFDGLTVGAQLRRDLTEDKTVTNSFGLVYTNSCLSVIAGLERNFTKKGELEDETRFTVRIGLRSLGDLEADSDLF